MHELSPSSVNRAMLQFLIIRTRLNCFYLLRYLLQLKLAKFSQSNQHEFSTKPTVIKYFGTTSIFLVCKAMTAFSTLEQTENRCEFTEFADLPPLFVQFRHVLLLNGVLKWPVLCVWERDTEKV